MHKSPQIRGASLKCQMIFVFSQVIYFWTKSFLYKVLVISSDEIIMTLFFSA